MKALAKSLSDAVTSGDLPTAERCLIEAEVLVSPGTIKPDALAPPGPLADDPEAQTEVESLRLLVAAARASVPSVEPDALSTSPAPQ